MTPEGVLPEFFQKKRKITQRQGLLVTLRDVLK